MTQQLSPINQMIENIKTKSAQNNPKVWTTEQTNTINTLANLVIKREATVVSISESIIEEPELLKTVFVGKSYSGVLIKLRQKIREKRNGSTSKNG